MTSTSEDMGDASPCPSERRLPLPAKVPDIMEPTWETRQGFIGVDIGEDRPELLDELLGAWMPHDEPDIDVADAAARAGKAACLEVALAHGHLGDNPHTLLGAIEGGHVPCVQLLCEKGKALVSEGALIHAAMHGQVACVRYLAPLLQGRTEAEMEVQPNEAEREVQPPVQPPARRGKGKAKCAQKGQAKCAPQVLGMQAVCNNLAYWGEVAALRTLVEGGCAKYMQHGVLLAAVRGAWYHGSFEAVKYVIEKGAVRCTFPCLNLVLQLGDPEYVKLLLSKCLPNPNGRRARIFRDWRRLELEAAARSGFTACIAVLMEHGCPWYPAIPFTAAKFGKVDVLSYAIAARLHLGEVTALGAIEGRQLVCFSTVVEANPSCVTIRVIALAQKTSFSRWPPIPALAGVRCPGPTTPLSSCQTRFWRRSRLPASHSGYQSTVGRPLDDPSSGCLRRFRAPPGNPCRRCPRRFCPP